MFSKLPCLLGTSTQTDAVLSALGNSRGLWVFSERPTVPHTHTHTASFVLRIQTRTSDRATWETHLRANFCADIQKYCLIHVKKKTLSIHIIGVPHIAKLTVPQPLNDTISLLLRKSAFRRDQCYQSKLICFDWSLMWPQSSSNYCLDGCAPAS